MQTNRGLIRTIVVILVALLILSFLGFNIRSIVESPTFQDNWDFVKGLVVNVWETYLKPAVLYVWGAVFPKLSLPNR